MSARRLFVYGASGHGKVVADIGRSVGLQPSGFIDDGASGGDRTVWGLPVLPWERFLSERRAWPDAVVALGVGSNHDREMVFERLARADIVPLTLAHASSVVAPSARIGAGTVLMALVAVNPDAVVHPGVIVNTGAVVEHDCVVGPFVHMSPKVALGGAVWIGARSHLGLGAVALPMVRIGADVTIGAGAVVHRDVADGLTMVGVPARPLQRRQERGGA